MSVDVLQLLVFAGAGATAVATIVAMVVPQWRRITRLALGHVDEPNAISWRQVHLEGDRRPTFQTRADAPRRGLFGRRAR